ncbi:ankyrin repeat domain-containing protein [Geobacter sp.]|uniref:ankyrin repeat domain-containing protein n=1 Tax=Geobacter sp. TaxID=46610 RepID=UPI0026196B74|nr:ankyrin repeat domain-containing protein [Geobacter sp.]
MKTEEFFSGLTLELVNAASRGDDRRVEELIKRGANPNAKGKDDMIPLVWVTFFAKNKQGTKALLANGADPNLKIRKDLSPMILAVKEKDPAFLKMFLESKGNPNIEVKDSSLLSIAAYEDNWEHMRMLIAHGADINKKDSVNATLIYQLALTNDYEQIYYLLQRGADYSTKTTTGDSVLQWIFNHKLDPKSEAFQWQQKCRVWLESHGIRNPGKKQKSKEEVDKLLNDIWESSKNKK